MKSNKLYNLIIPLWILVFFPPYVFVPLIGNLIIDGSIIFVGLKINGVQVGRDVLKWVILKAYFFGFFADFIGACILLFLEASSLPIVDFYRIWNNAISVSTFVLVIALVGYLIFLFNYRLLIKIDLPKRICMRVAIAMGVITAPWMFLIPTSWFAYFN